MKLCSVSSVADGGLPRRLVAGRLFLILGSSMALGGCYPALKAVQPKVKLTVVDSRGVAIEGASFTLATFHQPFPFPHSTVLTTYRTDHEGSLALRKRREWAGRYCSQTASRGTRGRIASRNPASKPGPSLNRSSKNRLPSCSRRHHSHRNACGRANETRTGTCAPVMIFEP